MSAESWRDIAAAAKRLKILEERAKQTGPGGLMHFVRYFWHVLEPGNPFIDGWAMQAIAEHLEAITFGELNRLLINVSPGFSKPVHVDELIMTDHGFVKLKDIRVGDRVLTHKGRFKEVTAVHEQGVLPLVKIVTHNGRAVRAAPDHPFLTPRGWVKAGDLTDQDYVGAPHIAEPFGDGSMTPEEARLLGYLVGDGCISQRSLAYVSADEEAINDFIACAQACGFYAYVAVHPNRNVKAKKVVLKSGEERWGQGKVRCIENGVIYSSVGSAAQELGISPALISQALRNGGRIRDPASPATYRGKGKGKLVTKASYFTIERAGNREAPILDWLRSHDLYRSDSYTKRIPDTVFRSGPEALANFVGAYWSCDGTVVVRHQNKKTTMLASATTVSRGLAEDLQRALMCLGITSRVRRNEVNLKTKKQGDTYVSWQVINSSRNEVAKIATLPGLLTRKRKLAERAFFDRFPQSIYEDAVIEVNLDGEGECRCLTVEEDASFTVNGLIVHNSLLTSVYHPAWEWGPMNMAHLRGLSFSYAAHLTERDNDRMRTLIMSKPYQELWGDRFKLTSDAKIKIANDHMGWQLASSVRGVTTGERSDRVRCCKKDTLILTDQGQLKIADIVDNKLPVKVYGYNHRTNSVQLQNILEYETNFRFDFIELRWDRGSVTCTPEHPIFIYGRGYTPASEVREGDIAYWTGMPVGLPELWAGNSPQTSGSTEILQHSLQGGLSKEVCPRSKQQAMHGLRQTDLPNSSALGAVGERRSVLQSRMLRHFQCKAEQSGVEWRQGHQRMQMVSKAVSVQSRRSQAENTGLLLNLLRKTISLGGKKAKRATVRLLWGAFFSTYKKTTLLLPPLHRYLSRQTDFWQKQWALYSWPIKQKSLPRRLDKFTKTQHQKSRRKLLSSLWARPRPKQKFGCSPYRLQQTQSSSPELDYTVPMVPRQNAWADSFSPTVQRAVIKSVKRLPEELSPVYNLRVDPHHNYFANGILTHNCDDGHNVSEGESERVRSETVRWFKESMSNRLNHMEKSSIVVIMQRVHECLHPDTLISTGAKMVKATDIQAGDPVITSAGQQNVIAVASRPYSGRIVGIKALGYPHSLWFTDSHLILTTDGWVTAGNITKGHTLVASIPDRKPLDLLSLWPKAPEYRVPFKSEAITFTGERKRTMQKHELEALISEGKNATEIANHFGLKCRNTTAYYMNLYDLSFARARITDAKILENEDFWRFVGRYLADGCVTKGGKNRRSHVRLTIGVSKKSCVDDMEAVLTRLGFEVKVRPTKCSTYEVWVHSIQLGEFLQGFGVGAHNKFLPEWVSDLPPEFIKQMFLGYWRGDGSRAKNCANVGSVSLQLLEGFQRAFFSIGINTTVLSNGKSNGKESIIKTGPGTGRKIKKGFGFSYQLRIPFSDAPWLGIDGYPSVAAKNILKDGKVLSRIYRLEYKNYEGPVYDIQTPNQDFRCGLITAHNCDIAGSIIEDAQGMGYEHLCIPMRYEIDGPWAKSTKIGWHDPRTIDGELAWPERFPEKVVDNLERDLGPYAFSSQYQQNPAPRGGGIIKRHWFRLWEHPQNKFPFFQNVVAALDPAYTEKDENDPSAMVILGTFRHPETNEPGIMFINAWRKRLPIHGDTSPKFPGESFKAYERRCGESWGLVEWVNNSCEAYGVQQLYIEAKASGISVFQEIERRQSLRPWSCELVDTGRQDKTSRVTAVQPIFSQGLVWAPDRDWADMVIAEMINFPKYKYDDLCFVAGTKIITKRGEVPIEQVTTNDKVLTPFGWKSVSQSCCTGYRKVITRQNLTGTPNHPVFTLDKGFTTLDSITIASRVSKVNLCDLIRIIRLSMLNSTECSTDEWAAREDIISLSQRNEREQRDSTSPFGNSTLAKASQKATRSITLTMIPLIAALRIWNAYQGTIIGAWLKMWIERRRCLILKPFALSRKRGTPPQKGENGTDKMRSSQSRSQAISARRSEVLECLNVRFAGKNSNGAISETHYAQVLAPVLSQLESMGKVYHSNANTNVIGVEQHLNESVPAKSSAPRGVNSVIMPVYNLSVNGSPCYYANGILVHNCDATSLGLRKLREMGLLQFQDEREYEEFFENNQPVVTEPLYPV